MNALTGICTALCAVTIMLMAKCYFDDKRKYDAEDRRLMREVLAHRYEIEDDLFRRQLAREQTFRDAAREEASA